jgi:ABC-type transporter Mla subunit MlaD
MEDLEARVAALEASQADYRSVLAAANALGANQREHSLRLVTVASKIDTVESRLGAVESRLGTVESELGTVKTELADFRLETRASLRSVDEHLAELRDLTVGRSHN